MRYMGGPPPAHNPLFENTGMCSEISGEQPSHKSSNGARQDIGAARQFLQYLADVPDAVFQFRVLPRNGGIPQNRHGTFADCCDYLAEWNAAKYDIYVTVNAAPRAIMLPLFARCLPISTKC
jgi:hypothetical protein